ncbi:MAG: lysophospholipase [Hydrogenophaga sp.]|nr:lysophospholipase [Hydrogenophaga sp.]
MSLPLTATLGDFTAQDGTRLTTYRWTASQPSSRGRVHLIHGLGEHAGRYEALAQVLLTQGFEVWAHDHRGHGRSDGPRGVLPHTAALIDDAASVLRHVQAASGDGLPCVVLGHSMGGLVAAALAARGTERVDGLVLSSPALALALSWPQQRLLAFMHRWAPDVTISNGLHPERLSHDPAAVAAYVNDPWVHSRVSARLIHGMLDNAPGVFSAAAQWRIPTLLMFAGDDALVDPEGSRRWARAAPASVLDAQEFPGLFHEIFNETPELAAPVWARLQDWLKAF